MRGLFLLHKDT